MTFAYTGGATNGGNSASASTGTHGITINSGDLVICHVNSNSTTPISADAGGVGFTEAVDEQPSPETARHALYWKVAGVSEPTSYTFTVGNAEWRVNIKVFTSATAAEENLTPVTNRTGSNTVDLVCDSGDGRTVADNAVSVVCGGKDNRAGSSDPYTQATNSYVSVIGNVQDQASAMAHRIWTTGGNDATINLDVASNDDGINDRTYSIHMSWVESSGATEVAATTGLVNYDGLAPTLENIKTAAAELGYVDYAGLVPDLERILAVNAAAGITDYVGFASTIERINTVTAAAAGYVNADGFAPTPERIIAVAAALGYVNYDGFVPGVQTGGLIEVIAALGRVDYVGQVPVIERVLSVLAELGYVNYVGLVPGVTTGTVFEVASALGQVDFDGLVPTVARGITVTTEPAQVDYAGLTPSIAATLAAVVEVIEGAGSGRWDEFYERISAEDREILDVIRTFLTKH